MYTDLLSCSDMNKCKENAELDIKMDAVAMHI